MNSGKKMEGLTARWFFYSHRILCKFVAQYKRWLYEAKEVILQAFLSIKHIIRTPNKEHKRTNFYINLTFLPWYPDRPRCTVFLKGLVFPELKLGKNFVNFTLGHFWELREAKKSKYQTRWSWSFFDRFQVRWLQCRHKFHCPRRKLLL